MSAPQPLSRGMRFAESQLRRHGWRRGQGLGKREDGIAEAIRVKVKCDTAGVGHDAGEPFSFHWWDHVFNEAAANIAVEAGQDGISVKTLSEQGVRISNKKPRKAGGAGSMLYGRFVKSATLTARGEELAQLPAGSESSEEEEKLDLSSARRLTDEELMRACGGRTAHKGARHGLTMSAKLARLEEQERAFLAAYRRKESSPPAERQEKQKKKRKRPRDGADPEVLQGQEPSGEGEVVGEQGRVVKKRKKKQQQEEEEEEDDKEEPGVTEEQEKRKKKKKKKEEEEKKEEPAETEEEEKRKKKKKKKEEKEEPAGTEEEEKRKKKKKKKEEEEEKEEPAGTEVPLDTAGPGQAGHSPRKKRKKRKREPE